MSKTIRRTTTTETTADKVVASVPLPSADLIIYRFDQIDEQLRQTSDKLDNMTSSFLTKEEASAMKLESLQRSRDQDLRVVTLEKEVKELVATDNRQQGSIDATRRYLAIGLTLLGIIVTAASIYFGVRGH